MSYYKPSYNQTVAMSRGGRGGFSSSRGSSYRGSSRGSSWSSSRGSYSSSSRGNGRGKFSNSFSNNSFDSRSKYPSSDKYAGSRSHNDDYRKSYKPESGSYSNKDHRSPDRKRMRTESSHERSFGSGSREYNSSRYESDRRSFSSDGRSSGPFSGRKEEFRKPPPPPPPISSSPRGGYRGRVSSRGMIRSRLRERPLSSSVRRTRLVESSYGVRRRVLTGRTHDYARRLKISKMRSVIRRKKEETSDKEEEDDEEDSDIDIPDEKTIIKSEDVEDEVREHKSSDETEKKSTPKKSSPKKEEEVASDKDDSKDDDTDEKNKSFIKLTCPHCLTRSTTFAKYSMHLHSGRHASAMRRVAMKQKSILSQMRLVQRRAQRELEKNASDLALRTSWCPLCKLNYKQAKLTHQTSQAHKDMKKFLMPYCKICKLTFKSPMLYESHCCSIEHIKRKATATGGDDISDKEETEEDLENFMTIDSVGDMDEEGDTAEKKEGDSKSKEHINVGIENIKKVEVHYCDLCRLYLPRVSEDEEMNKILVRHCRQRTHLQKYIRYKEDRELAKKAEKLQRKETAEKEKEKEEEASHKETDDKMDDATVEKKKENDIPKEGGSGDTETANVEEEKIWADVDKDLGDILAEAESGAKSSDEDEDSVANGERYDRFKYSEKNGKKMKVKVEEKDEETKKLEDAEAEK